MLGAVENVVEDTVVRQQEVPADSIPPQLGSLLATLADIPSVWDLPAWKVLYFVFADRNFEMF